MRHLSVSQRETERMRLQRYPTWRHNRRCYGSSLLQSKFFAFEAWRGLEAKEVSPPPTLRPLTPSLSLSFSLSLSLRVSRCAALDATRSRVETHAAQGTRGMRTKGSFALFGSVHKRGRYIPARPLIEKTRALVQPRILSRNYGRSAFFA